MTAFRNDPAYRKILKVYRSCFQDLHKKVVNEGKPYIMESLRSGLVQAGLQVEKVGSYREGEFYEDTGEGFLRVENRFLVGTAFLERLSGSDILDYLYKHNWTDIDVVLLSVKSEKPEWLGLDKDMHGPASWWDIIREHVPDLDEPDEYWLNVQDPEAYYRLLEEEKEFDNETEAANQDQPTVPEPGVESE